jgi:hypothetical protein
MISRKTRFVALAGALLGGAMLLMAQAVPNDFVELDGDSTVEGTACTAPNTPSGCRDDWNLLNGTGNTTPGGGLGVGSSAGSSAARTFISGSASIDVFTGGGSKDFNPIGDWKWKSGGTPDKDAITNGYSAAYKAPNGDLIFEFGGDRFATNGDANIGLWFMQQDVHPTGAGTGGGSPFSGAHTLNDIFVVSAFTQGGGVATITVYTWDPGCTTGPGGTVVSNPGPGQCADANLRLKFSSTPSLTCVGVLVGCAIVNPGPINVTWPYLAKFGNGTTLIPTGGFFEGGIDVTTILGLAGGNTPCFTSFLLETRSSQTTSAVLKDFVSGNFQLCSLSIAKTCTAASVQTAADGSNFVHYTFRVDVKSDGGGTIWDPAVTDTFPAGATTPVAATFAAGPIIGGATVSAFGSFNSLATSGVVNHISGTAAATSGGPQTVALDKNGVLQSNIGWSIGSCNPSVSATLTLNKSCIVNIIPQSSPAALVIQVEEKIQVCNTGPDQVKGVTVSDKITGGVKTAVAGLGNLTLNGTLAASGQCATATLDYLPKSCDQSALTPTGNPGPGTAGRCTFTDEATSTGGFTDFNHGTQPDVGAPGAADATCYVCPGGSPTACANQANTPSPIF